MLVAVAGCSLPNVASSAPGTAAPSASASATAASPAPTATPTATPAAAPTVAMTPLPQASGQLTGTQLQTVLLTQSDFPAGYTLSSQTAVDSGGSLSSSPATYDLATVSCATFVEHLGSTGFGETAMAANTFSDQSQAYDQVVYQFGSTGAASGFVSGIKALAGRCRSFTVTDNGTTGTFSLSAVDGAPVGGHPSIELTQTGRLGASSIVLTMLLSASGADVFAGAAAGVGASAPTSMATSTIVYTLMKRQSAAAVLG